MKKYLKPLQYYEIILLAQQNTTYKSNPNLELRSVIPPFFRFYFHVLHFSRVDVFVGV